MSGIQSGLLLFGVLMTLLLVRVPIGVAMFMVGAGGYVAFTGGEWTPLLNSLKNLAYARLSNYDLIVIPLFLLMGQFVTHGGLSRSLFRFVSARSWATGAAASRWRPSAPARWAKATADIDELSAKGGNGKTLLEDARALIGQYDR